MPALAVEAKLRDGCRARGNVMEHSPPQAKGFAPLAVLNFVAPPHARRDDEVLSLAELAASFDLGAVGRSNAVADVHHLEAINRAHARRAGGARVASCA